jgi:hypothetical protein
VLSGEAAPAASEAASSLLIKVLAAVDAEPGIKSVRITLKPKNREPVRSDVAVVVRPPFALRVRPEPLTVAPGGMASFWVGVQREPGFHGPVELRLSGLPVGLKPEGKLVVAPDADGIAVTLKMTDGSPPLSAPATLGITGVARMPRGPVRVDSAVRPMLAGQTAEK